MINVPNGAYIDMRLGPLKLLFRHLVILPIRLS
jgi:hypothetical protein